MSNTASAVIHLSEPTTTVCNLYEGRSEPELVRIHLFSGATVLATREAAIDLLEKLSEYIAATEPEAMAEVAA